MNFVKNILELAFHFFFFFCFVLFVLNEKTSHSKVNTYNLMTFIQVRGLDSSRSEDQINHTHKEKHHVTHINHIVRYTVKKAYVSDTLKYSSHLSLTLLVQRWKREPLIMKQTTRKPESREENPRNRNPANPNAIEMSDWTQNAFVAVHVSVFLSVLAISVPAEFADSNRYANT